MISPVGTSLEVMLLRCFGMYDLMRIFVGLSELCSCAVYLVMLGLC